MAGTANHQKTGHRDIPTPIHPVAGMLPWVAKTANPPDSKYTPAADPMYPNAYRMLAIHRKARISVSTKPLHLTTCRKRGRLRLNPNRMSPTARIISEVTMARSPTRMFRTQGTHPFRAIGLRMILMQSRRASLGPGHHATPTTTQTGANTIATSSSSPRDNSVHNREPARRQANIGASGLLIIRTIKESDSVKT
jgi:hypothetical protein